MKIVLSVLLMILIVSGCENENIQTQNNELNLQNFSVIAENKNLMTIIDGYKGKIKEYEKEIDQLESLVEEKNKKIQSLSFSNLDKSITDLVSEAFSRQWRVTYDDYNPNN